MSDTGSYVYLASRGVTGDDLADLAGLQGSSVRVVQSGGLVAVVSTVDLSEFGEDALRENLEDLDWLEQVARTHDQVVNAVSEITTVAPMRLATILYDDDRVTALLEEWGDSLTATLDRVQDCREWSVKVLAQSNSEPDPGQPDHDQEESGTAYLRRRRSETARKTETAEASAALADQIHRSLSACSNASRQLPPQDKRLTGHQGEMTLNGAYLVGEGRGPEFEQLTLTLSDQHPQLALEVNGPWPPYSFATLESPEQR